MEIRQIALEDIVLDPGLNLRDKIDDEAVERYAEAWDKLPPVTVFDVEGRWLLADGFHRHAAAQRLNKSVVSAEIHEGNYHAALECAADANFGHGLPLNRHERRRAIEVKVRFHPDWSDRRLSEALGVSRDSVAKARKQLADAGQIPSAAMRQGADGKLYPASLPRDPNERLPQGPEVVSADDGERDDRSRSRPFRADPPGGSNGSARVRGPSQAALGPGPSGDEGAGAPWEGDDQFASGNPSPPRPGSQGGGTQTVVVKNTTEMVGMIADQIREIATWLMDDGFPEAYRTADPSAQKKFQDAVDLLAGQARDLA